jgi:tyrosyl-tRNA synthetase
LPPASGKKSGMTAPIKLYEDLVARGLIQDATHPEKLAELLTMPGVVFYCGFDPSGPSLHAGHLLPLALMERLRRAGHRPLALIGGSTGMIGDPTGKSEERKLLDLDTLWANIGLLQAQFERLLPGVRVVNNADWTRMGYLEFLRTIGKHITVNYMLAKESVRARLEDREQGISYTEFSYMLLQAFDFAHLARTEGCRLQVAGSDQWGNITCGIELHRKMGGEASATELFGLTCPLLKTSSGAKFGKTESGTSLWLDPRKTSAYRFFQYWVNVEDADVERYLKMFTFLSLEEVAQVTSAHDEDRAKRTAQRRLAEEVTRWVHGADGLRRAEAASQVMFGGSLENLTDGDLEPLRQDLPSTELPRAELSAGISLIDLLVRTALCSSKGAAKQLLTQGGVYLNNRRESDASRSVTLAELATESMLILRAGKKSYHLVKVI